MTADRFHVFNRGVDGQDLFSIEDDWGLFESLIERVCDDHSFSVNAYALMSNHFHFLVDLSSCDDRAGLSDGIGVLQSTYAKYFNERTSRHGPLFDPRFVALSVADETRIHRTLRYIHRNPLAICGPRALGAYRWSSLPVYLGRRPAPTWLSCEQFVPRDPVDHLADLTGRSVQDLLPLDSLPPLRRASLDMIVTALDAVEIDDGVTLDRRDRNEMIVMLAIELRVADVVAIAQHLELSEARIRQLTKRGRTRCHDDHSFGHLAARVREQLVWS